MTFSNTEAHLASKNARNAVQRVTELERQVKALEDALQSIADSSNKVVQTVIDSTNNALKDIHAKVDAMSELVRATVDVVGLDSVGETLAQNRSGDDERNRVAQTKQIADGLANGELKAADAIGETSYLVFTEKGKDGQPLQFGARKQFAVSQVMPEFRASLMGKGVGATITSTSGHTFEVVEFYDVVQKPAPAAPATTETK